MVMRSVLRVGFCLWVLAACSLDNVADSTDESRTALLDGTSQPRASISAQEMTLIDAISARLDPRAVPQIRALLMDRRVIGIELPDSATNDLLKQLMALRTTRRASPDGPRVFPAMLVVLDKLPDTTASVVVVRRPTGGLGDAILLKRNAATREAFQAGIVALFRLRKRFGDVPNADMSISVRGVSRLRKWSPEMNEQADRELARVLAKAPEQVRGLGMASTIRIPLVPTR